jgi:hypothetical protein
LRDPTRKKKRLSRRWFGANHAVAASATSHAAAG